VNSKIKESIISERSKFITSDTMVLNILISTAIGLILITIAVGIVGDNPFVLGALSVAIIATVGSILLVSRGITLPGRLLLPPLLTIIIGIIAFNRGGLYHISISGIPVVIVLAGLLLGSQGAFITAALASMTAGIIGYADIHGLSPFSSLSRTGYDDIVIAATFFFTTAIVLRVIFKRFTESIREAEQFGQAQETSNVELRTLQSELNQRVIERTAQLEKRVNQLDAISSVARSTASLQNIEELLPAITKLVSQKFNYYHTGIFLLDDRREYAVLRAANSSGGQQMLARQHKLKRDLQSIVGFVTTRGEPRIALDVGTDAIFFDNPNLPDTRSELALPLRAGNRVIGALDVQSTQPDAFTEMDVNILSTLADQIAIAIENARLFSESREALKKSEETFSQYVQQEWSNYARRKKTTGYKFDGTRITPLDPKETREKVQELPKTRRLSFEKESRELSIPIRFRGRVIGILDVKSKSGNRKWTQDDIILLEAAAERTALALENTRLVESSQRRASRERTIGEISSKIGAISNIESIMQSAVEELGRKIGGAAEVTLELSTDESIPVKK
jgi:GAF domain-containing protein